MDYGHRNAVYILSKWMPYSFFKDVQRALTVYIGIYVRFKFSPHILTIINREIRWDFIFARFIDK